MRAGRLDRRITLQRRTDTQDAAGQSIPTWAALAHNRPASYAPTRGDERFVTDQYIARQQVEFRIRYSADLSTLNPLDRLIYPPPASGNTQSPDNNAIFDILDVAEIGRREGLRIIAARRPEATS